MPRSTKRRQISNRISKPSDVTKAHFDLMMTYVPDGYRLARTGIYEYWRDFYFVRGDEELMLSLPRVH